MSTEKERQRERESVCEGGGQGARYRSIALDNGLVHTFCWKLWSHPALSLDLRVFVCLRPLVAGRRSRLVLRGGSAGLLLYTPEPGLGATFPVDHRGLSIVSVDSRMLLTTARSCSFHFR